IGGTPMIADALVQTIVSYNYGGESHKSTVSMARLLRMFDEQPGEFDEELTYQVFWHLKWVTSSLLAVPEVPLRTIRAFLDDMERRFRTAGHSLRPVHKCRFYLYDHTGEKDSAEREFAAWLAAGRDELTDCDACERREQGRWYAEHHKDADALEVFEPTLSGMRTCSEEPQLTIADSMLPLVRLGRLDEARANHLRGYRLVRGKVSTCASVAQHIEFCALTGNEGRGVEILAEHRAWLASPVDSAETQMMFHGGAAVLLRRLVALGHGGTAVADVPGTDGTAAGLLALVEREAFALAARFDARNGSDFVSTQLRARLAQEPLLDALPLGVRSTLVAAPRPATPAPTTTVAADIDELLERARTLWPAGHPDAEAAWERYAEAAEAQGVTLTDEVAAELARCRASALLSGGRFAEGVELFRQAVELFDRVGRLGAAHAARAHSLIAVAHPEAPSDLAVPWASDLDTLTAETADYVTQGSALPIEYGAVLGARLILARVALFRAEDEAARAAARARTAEEADRLAAAAAEHDWPHRLAQVAEVRAQLAMTAGEPAEAELRTAVAECLRAQRPWQAVELGLMLGEYLLHSGDPAGAESVLTELLDAARGPVDDPAHYGNLLVTLTNAAAANGRLDPAIEYALRAAHEFDRLGDRHGAAHCRLGLASLLRDRGRPSDAAAVLEESVAEIEELMGPEAGLHARYVLGSSLLASGQAADAAEVLVAAAAQAAEGDNADSQALLAAEAAHALSASRRYRAAEEAFTEAIRLAAALDRPGAVVRLTRAAAWNLLEVRHTIAATEGAAEADAAVQAALAMFSDATAALESASDGPDLNLAHERAVTELQWAQALWTAERTGDALDRADRAATRLEAGLPDLQETYAHLVGLAAQIDQYAHGKPEEAAARLAAATSSARERDAAEAVAILDEIRESMG
ncbi:MAG TPA: hypothetical protein VLH10_26920, partial [Yinghuangia sp.]|nr:hypothetical protein [Yinghuangia sp.]